MSLKTARQQRIMRKAIRMMKADQGQLALDRWFAVWGQPPIAFSKRSLRIFANRNKRAHDLRIAIVQARHNRRFIP